MYKNKILSKYKNKELSIEVRIKDLMEKMTLNEKVRQLDQYIGTSLVDKIHPMQNTAMAADAKVRVDKLKEIIGDDGVGCIHDLYGYANVNNEIQRYCINNTRLGIPVLFSEEALHGLARPGCTVFPHAISQAASFDEGIVEKIGKAIASETKSFGICETFGPVLDLAREPRWGRTEESYGEDTYLCSRMGVAMIKGLQGNNISDKDSIIAEPKHFAVHGIPEGGLNTSHTSIGQREMLSCHLPVFEAAFVEGGAVNAMCSYNAIDGEPCSSNYELLTETLREKWGMPGFVRSDLGAIARLHNKHKTAATEKDAIKQALLGGTDMQYYDFSHKVYQEAIIELFRDKVISIETINQAVKRVLRVKFMLGLFEKPYTDESLSKSAVRCSKHQELALMAGLEAICLLKNKNSILPLSKDIKNIAVIGPSANTARLGDYTPYIEGFKPITVLQGIKDIVSKDTCVKYAKGTGILEDELECISGEYLRSDDGSSGLKGEYFNNSDFIGEPIITRIDQQINFNWIISKPDEMIMEQGFTVRWKGKLIPKRSCKGLIGTMSGDSMRLWINDTLVIDGWGQTSTANKSVAFSLEENIEYDIKLEYCKDNNGAQVILGWNLGNEDIDYAVKLAKEADVAIVALGDSQRTCGEGVDRTELNFPGKQLELLKAVHATGTPVILVLQNGRAMTIKWENENVAAIIEAWYTGENGGKAIAEVIFGDYNPAGRLPVSFPKSLGQIPVYYSRMRGGSNNYVEEDNKALFAFGYGLSYTTFSYTNLEISPESIEPGDKIKVSFDVMNTGSFVGDEVVQLYISDLYSSMVRPEKELRKFKRIHLKVAEKIRVSFMLCSDDMRLLDKELKWVVEKGAFKIIIGSSSDKEELSAQFNVL
ncbi:MAG TPA: glycoside hydrolase family 3 C-terminal domain-containing protein [Ruminiclostridium sp.]